MQYSPIRTQVHYKRGAYLLWKSTNGRMIPGLLNGYAITCFECEQDLKDALAEFSYSELIRNAPCWKIGTAEITESRLNRMFNTKSAFNADDDIWDRYMIPFKDRLAKYQNDAKAMETSHCVFMRNHMVPMFKNTGSLAILLVPLVIGFKGTVSCLEKEISTMLRLAGATVFNDKNTPCRLANGTGKKTRAMLRLDDTEIPDKLMDLTVALSASGFDLHPDMRRVYSPRALK